MTDSEPAGVAAVNVRLPLCPIWSPDVEPGVELLADTSQILISSSEKY